MSDYAYSVFILFKLRAGRLVTVAQGIESCIFVGASIKKNRRYEEYTRIDWSSAI